jgi:hypothetical protein
MARQLPRCVRPFVSVFRLALSSRTLAVVRVPRAAAIVGAGTLLAAALALVWLLATPAQPASCGTPCLCRYCDEPLVNGRCGTTGDGGCIGCAGTCTSKDNCMWSGSSGGCGPISCGCRNRDCLPQETAVPTPPPPTPPPPPPSCQPSWDEIRKPSLAGTDYKPAHPVVVTQDPDAVGFTIPLSANSGQAIRHTYEHVKVCRDGSNDCPNGPWDWECEEHTTTYNDPLIKIDITMDLDASSKDWINGYLNRRYYGAHQLEDLPNQWVFWEGEAMQVQEDWHYSPRDPGLHRGEIILFTKGTPISAPQEVRIPYQVPVWLVDTTIGQ